jgi:hypothetical protein
MTSSSATVTVAHSFNVSFMLARDPTALAGQTSVNYLGHPTGTGNVNESVMMSSSSQTNVGSGAISSVGNMTLHIDRSACTFHFQWEWGIAATITIDGAVASMPNPEDIGALLSTEVPLGDWSTGIAYSSGFPVHGQVGGTGFTPDYYELVSNLGYYLFLSDMTAARGPATVSFVATPDTPDQ